MNKIISGLLILFLCYNHSSAQFQYSLGVGTGLYFTSETLAYDNSQKFFTGLVKLNYKIKNSFRKASIQAYALPEFYGNDSSVKSLKLKFDANYSEKHDNITWGLNLSKKNYMFDAVGITNDYDIYFLQSFLDWNLTKTMPVKTTVGIAYQDISGTFQQKSDLLFIENRIYHYFTPYTHLSYGLYAERFSLSSSKNNSGWRFGPTFVINHLKHFVFNFYYKFLFHTSEATSDFSSENILRLVAGKFIAENTSAFLIADYSWRNFKYKEESDALPYSLIDTENNIHLKIGYNLSKITELYLKSGYFNQDFLQNNLSLKGWNIIAGFRYGN